eukprot:43930-Hanusia_phi.AAC.1
MKRGAHNNHGYRITVAMSPHTTERANICGLVLNSFPHCKGACRSLPEGFQWKPIRADQAFELWMHGTAEHGYPPFNEVSRRDFSSGSVSDLEYLMKHIQEPAESKDIWVEDPNYEPVKRIYIQCEEYLLEEYKLPGVKKESDDRFS